MARLPTVGLSIETASLVLLAGVLYQLELPRAIDRGYGLSRTPEPLSSFPYECRRINDPPLQACEDMWLSESTRQLFLACSNSLSHREWLPKLNHHKRNLNDVIVSMNIDEPIGDSLKLQTLEIPEPFGPTGGQELHVLGIKGVEDDNGKIRLWVVNNRPAVDTATSTLLDQGLSGANSTVEVFRVAKAKGKLEHVETFTDPEISTPNNIAPLGGDSNGFYFTNDHGKSKTGWGHILSPYLGTGSLSFCNSTSCREVVSGLKFPNGLVKGQDGLIYVPSSFVGGIGVYKALPNGDVQKVGHVPTENALDNLSVDREGHIWAAAFHAGQRIIDGFDDPLNALSPTGALRVKKGAEGYEVERVLEDGKIEVLPATTTVVHDAKTGRLFFSGMF